MERIEPGSRKRCETWRCETWKKSRQAFPSIEPRMRIFQVDTKHARHRPPNLKNTTIPRTPPSQEHRHRPSPPQLKSHKQLLLRDSSIDVHPTKPTHTPPPRTSPAIPPAQLSSAPSQHSTLRLLASVHPPTVVPLSPHHGGVACHWYCTTVECCPSQSLLRGSLSADNIQRGPQTESKG